MDERDKKLETCEKLVIDAAKSHESGDAGSAMLAMFRVIAIIEEMYPETRELHPSHWRDFQLPLDH